MLKRLFTAILASALLLGSLMAFNVSAAETNEYRQAKGGFTDYDMEVWSYIRYYYDTSDPKHTTKAYAYSSYFGENTTPYTTKPVYIIDQVTAVSTSRVTYTRKAVSNNFKMNQTEHVDEYSMSNDMLTFASNVTIGTLYSTCYIVTFNDAYSHTNPESCPRPNEQELIYVSAYK